MQQLLSEQHKVKIKMKELREIHSENQKQLWTDEFSKYFMNRFDNRIVSIRNDSVGGLYVVLSSHDIGNIPKTTQNIIGNNILPLISIQFNDEGEENYYGKSITLYYKEI